MYTVDVFHVNGISTKSFCPQKINNRMSTAFNGNVTIYNVYN